MSKLTIVSKLAFLIRLAAIVGLALLLLNLFMPMMGASGFASAVFDSPNTSPPDTSPPDPSHSPPGQFKSPPGQFKSPPSNNGGGNNRGYGPQRKLDLVYSSPGWIEAADSSGKIDIYGKPPDVSQHSDFPQGIDYSTNKLPCLDFVFDNSYYSGRLFYTLYMITEGGFRYRLQSFNPGCPDKSFVSWLLVPEISEDILLNEDLIFEVWVEADDNEHSPEYYYYFEELLILRGEDIIE